MDGPSSESTSDWSMIQQVVARSRIERARYHGRLKRTFSAAPCCELAEHDAVSDLKHSNCAAADATLRQLRCGGIGRNNGQPDSECITCAPVKTLPPNDCARSSGSTSDRRDRTPRGPTIGPTRMQYCHGRMHKGGRVNQGQPI